MIIRVSPTTLSKLGLFSILVHLETEKVPATCPMKSNHRDAFFRKYFINLFLYFQNGSVGQQGQEEVEPA